MAFVIIFVIVSVSVVVVFVIAVFGFDLDNGVVDVVQIFSFFCIILLQTFFFDGILNGRTKMVSFRSLGALKIKESLSR